ncbi:DIS3-like exonuclease 2 [Mangifera indica]|uniref:DIS3-like exonuclease 2 n=1 Tax=Mangifera indica TaxID=29780 RepID=UPI001CFB0A4F|nr:DIS3-like exonuclease 2 [Mangifera indica]
MVRGAADQSVVDDGVDKERKKKNRRSNRRSNRNASVSVSGSASTSISEIHGEAMQTLRNGNKTSFVSHSSSRQQGLDLHPSNNQESTKASDVTFCSMPTMHINEPDSVETSSMHHLLPADLVGEVVSESCPTMTAHDGWEYINEEVYAQSPIFLPHLSREAVNEALEKGYALRALFHVNAHNQLEAYCKIDGVQTDVLISGIAAQNRAVEGDVVLIKVDPLSLWTKMKGLGNNLALAEYSNFLSEANEKRGDTYKGKNKVELGYDRVNSNCTMLAEEFHNEDVFAPGETSYLESIEPACYNYVNGYHLATSDSTYVGFSDQQYAVESLSAIISLNPLKRPTGRVLAIIKSSPRRDCIVGYLNVNQWFNYRDRYEKNMKKKCLRISEHDYIQLTPTDPRFPEMMVLVKDLPDCINKRLEEGDATLEMELVAAQILCWGEESPFPQARVSCVFGQGGEVEPHVNAILYENAVCCSEFSQESLSCLPSVPWEVPTEEFKSRKDLRNLCIFTIDPSTATDLDDALSIERLSDGIFRVGVHVADVSYFVLPDTALDMEAQLRSTSVYMFQYKIPMLPLLLTENLGSLNPGVDRLAFSIFWDLNSSGNVVDRWIGYTIIRSCCKLSYENAQDIIDGKIDAESFNTSGNGLPQLYGNFEWANVIRSIRSLHEVSKTLKEKRFSEGALQLESSKPEFLLDEDGTPYDTMLSERKESNFLVEEFMLLANRTAAEVICRAFPESALLRRHPAPNIRKLKEFEAFCQKHGLELDTSSSGQFHQSLERVRVKLKDDSVLFNIIMNYAARPMQLASYFCSGDFKDNVDWSHYGLGVPLYTHFTSPLRRYPDIVVHRTLAAALEAEELLWDYKRKLLKEKQSDEIKGRFLSGIYYEKDALESMEGREALSAAALRHGVPCTNVLADVAAHCNDRKLASRNVKDACEKLYMWVLLRKKEVLLSEAKVLGLGPRFMSIYIHKLAIERRIYYDEVEGLKVEWLEATSTLVLNLGTYKRSCRRGGLANYRLLEDVALVTRPYDQKEEQSMSGGSANECIATNVGVAGSSCPCLDPTSKCGFDPGVFPMTVHLLSTIPVALHAVGGDDGPLDIGVRLYMSTYLG